jgi:hypothetical protein
MFGRRGERRRPLRFEARLRSHFTPHCSNFHQAGDKRPFTSSLAEPTIPTKGKSIVCPMHLG